MKSLFGYGKTTKALAQSGGWHIFDDTFDTITTDKFGNTLLPANQFNPNVSTLEITSPGIPPSNPLIQKAKNLISEYDYFKLPFSIWVTGSNGKTTTTEMIHYLIENSQVGGNIGTPLNNMDKDKIWILETSSFTLHYTKISKPNIFVILPITPDHISWHGSFENYEKDKLSALTRMDERDIAIIPKKYKNIKTDAYLITYENSEELIKYFNFKDIIFEEPFKLDEVLAKAIYKILFFKEKSLQGFQIDPHKIEEFYDYKKRLWVDDSKATNIDATIQAIKRYKNQKIYLILGGDSKSQKLTPLFEELINYNTELFLIGKDIDLFEMLAKKYNIKYQLSYTLQKAIYAINSVFKNGVAILSPASASLDQFNSYKERGETFKKTIQNLTI
jgi:UDP-N-acetylmuramoylalanine--D-glutamate ligase